MGDNKEQLHDSIHEVTNFTLCVMAYNDRGFDHLLIFNVDCAKERKKQLIMFTLIASSTDIHIIVDYCSPTANLSYSHQACLK